MPLWKRLVLAVILGWLLGAVFAMGRNVYRHQRPCPQPLAVTILSPAGARVLVTSRASCP